MMSHPFHGGVGDHDESSFPKGVCPKEGGLHQSQTRGGVGADMKWVHFYSFSLV